MLNREIKYLVASLAIIGTSACTPRTLILGQGTATQATRNTHVVKQPSHVPIKEEILINKNPDLGSRVETPHHNPSVGNSVGTPKKTPQSTTSVVNSVGTTTQNTPPVEEQNSTTSNIPQQNSGRMERIDFPVDEYRNIRKTGRSTVSGTIYLENSNSSNKFMGKKVKLYLNPVTSYSEQWYQESYLGGYKMSKSDPRLYNYLKFTLSNEAGKFNFFGVASGRYYLVGSVTCGSECGFSENRTIRLVKEVSVGRGTTRVDLMKNVP